LHCSLTTLRGITDEDKAINRIYSQINEAMLSSSIDAIKQRADTYHSLPGMESPDRKIKRMLNQLCLDLDKELIVFSMRLTFLQVPAS
jgi:hypothetical protein